MLHKEYKQIVAGADKAILFIHGIVGTPNHFNDFITLVPRDISIHNILLDGHGKGVKDFSKTSMKKWEEQVDIAIDELSQNHSEVYIVAHSLGCLLAIEQAVKKSKISKLFLLAVPLKLLLKPKMVVNSLKVYFNKVSPQNKELMAAKLCYGIDNDKNPLHYIGWVPRFLELFSKIKKTRSIIEQLKIPCIALQSLRDEMVSKSSKAILESNPSISGFELKNSGHYYYDDSDFLLIKENFMNFIS